MRADGRTCVLVLGMHRSGTSAVTGVLHILGVPLGRNLIPPDENNRKGYFESLDVCRLNNEVLNVMGSSWDGIVPLPPMWWSEARFASHVERIRDLVERDFGGASLFGIKDPRMNRVFPLWRRVLVESGITPVCVYSLRSPLEVARSLQQRDGFSVEYSLLSWMANMIESESSTRGCVRVPVHYHDLLGAPVATMEALGNDLGLVFPRKIEDAGQEISAFLDQGLRHQRSAEREESLEGIAGVAVGFHSLLGEEGFSEASPDWRDRTDRLVGDFRRSSGVFFNAEVVKRLGERENLRFRIESLEEQLRATSNLLANSREEVELARAEMNGLHASLAEARRTVADLEDRLGQLVVSTEAEKTERCRAVEEAASLGAEIQRLRSAHGRASAEAGSLRAENDRLTTSLASAEQAGADLAREKDRLALESAARAIELAAIKATWSWKVADRLRRLGRQGGGQ